MNEIACSKARIVIHHGNFQIVAILLALPAILRAQDTLDCSNKIYDQKCFCYKLEDGMYLDCQAASAKDVKDALKSLSHIHSLSVFDLEENEELLGPNILPQGICIKHIHMSQTNIKDIADDTLTHLRKCLETLSIVSGKLKLIPQKALSGLLKLISIDLSSNYIENIPSYSFYGLPLMKLNIKGNTIRDISESAFSSLELSLSDVDLSENNLTSFPIAAISKLRHLRSLRLAWNGMAYIPAIAYSDLVSLQYLDLSYNNFEFISERSLKLFPSLKTLSFHFNLVNNIHFRAFRSLTYIESLDLGHNRIKFLNPNVFQNNKNIEYIDLSFNHLHHIHGLFCNLPSLSEIYLSHNNILDVPKDSFTNSSKITAIYLEKNSISNTHSESFSNLENLAKLHLEFNFLNKVPPNIFKNTEKLIKLRLDNNWFSEIGNITFRSLGTLNEIRLNDNNLKYINKHLFSDSLHIEEVYLNDNSISFIEPGTFLVLTNLKLLNLRNNLFIDLYDVLPKQPSNILTLYLDSNLLSGINNMLLPYQENLIHLGLKNNDLKYINIVAFRNLSSLVHLELNSNKISVVEDYSFQHLILARYLVLRNNFISNVTSYTFYGLSELEDLDISHNRISYVCDMAFDTLKKLRSLNLSFNQLKTLHKNIFQHGLPLSSLSIDNCELEIIEKDTFAGLNNLKSLSLKYNLLKASDIAAIEIPGLKYLFFSFNSLDNLRLDAFAHLPLLEILVLEHCNIEYMHEGILTYNKHISRLHLGQNIISKMPKSIFNLTNSLLELNMSNNFLDFIPFDLLHNVTYIETLDISDNLLSRVELSGFEHLLNLKYLILRKNEINSITAYKKIQLLDVITLDLSYNRLNILPSVMFFTFPNLRNLNISYNDIINFDFSITNSNFLGTFLNLDISKNPIVSWTTDNRDINYTIISNIFELHISSTNMTNIDDIKFDSFISLQHLFLQMNTIRRLSISPFLKLNILEDLDLSFNKILQLKTCHFRGLFQLKSLCLSDNNIGSIEPFAEDLNNLRFLDLSHNKLQNILNEDVINLRELKVLYLSHNYIKYISATAFRSLNKITQIDLTHNKLDTISMQLLTSIESHVQNISIKGNNMICNCNKDNTWLWIQDHPKIIKHNAVSCLNNEYPTEKCDVPIISQLSIDKHKDSSVSVSWFIRNRTAIKALQLLYYGEDINTEVQTKTLDREEVSTRISDLEPNSKYVVCIITLNEGPTVELDTIELVIGVNGTMLNETFERHNNQEIAAEILMRSPSSDCISFNTFSKPFNIVVKPTKAFELSSILNRRMGLIIGCSLGCVVFFIMVSILLYTKVKERKRIAKADPDAWAELNDYHSVHSKEDILQPSTTVSTDNILLGMKN